MSVYLTAKCLSVTRRRGYKTFFVLNSVENEISNAHRYKKYQEIRLFLGSDKPRMLFFPLINVKMPNIVGILTFMNRKSFSVELSMKKFYKLGTRSSIEGNQILHSVRTSLIRAYNQVK